MVPVVIPPARMPIAPQGVDQEAAIREAIEIARQAEVDQRALVLPGVNDRAPTPLQESRSTGAAKKAEMDSLARTGAAGAAARQAMAGSKPLSSEERIRIAQRDREQWQQGVTSAENATRSAGPGKDSVLAGRYGVPESVPVEQLTPEQRRMIGYTPFNKGVPFSARGGDRIWDPTYDGGRGGYVPRAPAAMPEGATLRERAMSYGIDTSKYREGEEHLLASDLASVEARHKQVYKNFKVEDVPGGGRRYVPGYEVKAQQAQVDRDRFLKEQYARHGEELKGRGVSFKDFAAMYDSPAAGSNHRERAAFLRQEVLNDLDAESLAARKQAVAQNAKDRTMAQKLGTNTANVSFANALQNAGDDPDKVFSVLMGHHTMNPNLGLGNAAMGVRRGQDELDAAQIVAEGRQPNMNPVQRAQEAQRQIASMPNSPEKISAARIDARASMPAGQPVSIESENAHVVNTLATDARSVIENPARTESDLAFLQQWTNAYIGSGVGGSEQARFRGWCRALGIAPDKRAESMWYQLTGQNPSSLLSRMWGGMTGGAGSAPTAQAAGK
jgi:hypothetical protein